MGSVAVMIIVPSSVGIVARPMIISAIAVVVGGAMAPAVASITVAMVVIIMRDGQALG